MTHSAWVSTLLSVVFVTGCATATRPVLEPLSPPRPEDGACVFVVDRPGVLTRIGSEGYAELIGIDRRNIGAYALRGPDDRILPAGKREVVFRWNRGRDYAQATADCVLPRDARMVLRFEKRGNYIDFWLEEAGSGRIVDRRFVGAITYGRYIPLPIFLP